MKTWNICRWLISLLIKLIVSKFHMSSSVRMMVIQLPRIAWVWFPCSNSNLPILNSTIPEFSILFSSKNLADEWLPLAQIGAQFTATQQSWLHMEIKLSSTKSIGHTNKQFLFYYGKVLISYLIFLNYDQN